MKNNKKNHDFIHGESYVKGIMMNNDREMSVAIRKKDGTIGTKLKKMESLTKKNRIFNLFIIRGIVGFVEGSFNQFYAEELMKKIEDKKNYDYEKKKKSNGKLSSASLVLLIILFGILLYFIAPTIIAFYSKEIIKSDLFLNIIEIFLRLGIFLLFFIVFSFVERKNGTAMYHGAEHKFLWAYKNKEDLTINNAKKYPIRHPSCGTSLLFFMIIVSIPFFIFLNYENLLFRIVIILLLLPIIMGISFEITLFLEKSESKLAKILSIPGLLLQRLNTKEPDDKHLEVALASIRQLFTH